MPVLKINPINNNLSTGIFPGIGYGIQYKELIGIDLSFSVTVEKQGPASADIATLFSFWKWIAIGVEIDLKNGSRPEYNLILGSLFSISP